jgi:carbon storage regulator CsrA
MLVLTRKISEKIVIGHDIVLSVLQIAGSKVRIGVEAPPHVSVVRSELLDRRARSQANKTNILIVDDNPEDRITYRRFLEKGNRLESFAFAEATSGQEGLDLFSASHPDCVLLDYRLPDLDGLEFLAQMKKDRTNLDIPVIMLSGQGAEEIAVRAMKSGASDYLVKQRVTAESLQYSVRSVLHDALNAN